MIQPRPYQRTSIDQLYTWFRANPAGNPLLVLPTGSGKSIILATLIQEALANWPQTRILMLTHVRELIAQNADKLRLVWPAAPLGIHSAGLRSRATFEPIIFAGIQSVHRKAWQLGRFDLILIDEVHLVGNSADGMYRRFLAEARTINPAVRIIGLTATPWRTTSGDLTYGDDALFQAVAHEVLMLDLIRDGYLAPLISKRMATTLDVSGVQTRQGEFIARQLEQAVDREDITQAALDECLAYGADRHKWLVFCTGVAHAEHVAEALRGRGGNHGLRDRHHAGSAA
jgi:DNA repair protein RadD